MMRVYISVLFSLVFFSDLPGQETTYAPVKYPANYKAQIDLIYTRIDDWEGRMDLYSNPISEEPTPIIVNIHGGGWNHGTKESQTGFGEFFREGFAVANVEYRLVDVSSAPGAIEDIRCALVYLHNHAKEFNIDTRKIIIMGSSAGGHLALMAGLLNNNRRFDRNCSYSDDIEIASIIDKYGPTDLARLKNNPSVKRWLGDGYEDREFIESVSPLYHVNENSPPVIIVHGANDPIVPYEQSVLLYEKLKANNVKTEFVTIKEGLHGKFSKEERSIFIEKMWSFIGELGF